MLAQSIAQLYEAPLDCRADELYEADRAEMVRLQKRRDDCEANRSWIHLDSIDREAARVQRRMLVRLMGLGSIASRPPGFSPLRGRGS
jgi:hypothetical protein